MKLYLALLHSVVDHSPVYSTSAFMVSKRLIVTVCSKVQPLSAPPLALITILKVSWLLLFGTSRPVTSTLCILAPEAGPSPVKVLPSERVATYSYCTPWVPISKFAAPKLKAVCGVGVPIKVPESWVVKTSK